MLSGIGIMRFEELLERWEAGRLSHNEAAAALGVTERTFRRWRARYAEDGGDGLVDRRAGRPSPRRAPEDELQGMLRLYHPKPGGAAGSDWTRRPAHADLGALETVSGVG
jgi:transposase